MQKAIRLNYKGTEITVNPDKDTILFRSMRNPPFLSSRVLVGIDVYVRSTTKFKFFYAVKWDLTKEEGTTYHVLTKPQMLKLMKSLKEDDYVGYLNTQGMRSKLTYYEITSPQLNSGNSYYT